eukprot:366553-Chlamydomonas_euryale.AAC.15
MHACMYLVHVILTIRLLTGHNSPATNERFHAAGSRFFLLDREAVDELLIDLGCILIRFLRSEKRSVLPGVSCSTNGITLQFRTPLTLFFSSSASLCLCADIATRPRRQHAGDSTGTSAMQTSSVSQPEKESSSSL